MLGLYFSFCSLIIAIVLVVIGVVIVILFSTVFSAVFSTVNNSDNKLVCSSSVGNITLAFDDDNLIGESNVEDMTFNASAIKQKAENIIAMKE